MEFFLSEVALFPDFFLDKYSVNLDSCYTKRDNKMVLNDSKSKKRKDEGYFDFSLFLWLTMTITTFF